LNGLGAHALESIVVEDNGTGIAPEKMKTGAAADSGVPKNCTWH